MPASGYALTREISSWTLEDKIHIHARSCNILYIFCNDLGSFQGGWISQYKDTNQFLQIDLGKVTKVTRIATQGRYDAGWWSKTYTLAYSVDGRTFMLYNNGQVRDFSYPVTVKPAPYDWLTDWSLEKEKSVTKQKNFCVER